MPTRFKVAIVVMTAATAVFTYLVWGLGAALVESLLTAVVLWLFFRWALAPRG